VLGTLEVHKRIGQQNIPGPVVWMKVDLEACISIDAGGTRPMILNGLGISPKPEPLLTSLPLARYEHFSMADIGRDRCHFSVPGADQLGVHELIADVDISEQTTVTIARLHVKHKDDLFSFYEPCIRRFGGLGVWLSAMRRVVNLGRINTDVAN
jgi:hypothetical protein